MLVCLTPSLWCGVVNSGLGKSRAESCDRPTVVVFGKKGKLLSEFKMNIKIQNLYAYPECQTVKGLAVPQHMAPNCLLFPDKKP